MEKHLWEAEHPYYCNLSNYTCNDVGQKFKSFDEFLEEWKDSDLDYNLLFRWDWHDSNNPENEIVGDELQIFWLLQRKGHYIFSIIKVTKEDEPKVVEFLKPHWEYMRELWEPLNR